MRKKFKYEQEFGYLSRKCKEQGKRQGGKRD